jgi:hypothetical protein
MRPVKAVAMDLGIREESVHGRARKLGITFYKSSRRRGVNGLPIALISEAQEQALREFPNRRKQ